MSVIQIAAGIATVLGFIATTSVISYKYGKARMKREEIHDELVEGHKAVHNDIERMSNEINGGRLTLMSNCPVCGNDEG
jgi:hypothetical protein